MIFNFELLEFQNFIAHSAPGSFSYCRSSTKAWWRIREGHWDRGVRIRKISSETKGELRKINPFIENDMCFRTRSSVYVSSLKAKYCKRDLKNIRIWQYYWIYRNWMWNTGSSYKPQARNPDKSKNRNTDKTKFDNLYVKQSRYKSKFWYLRTQYRRGVK